MRLLPALLLAVALVPPASAQPPGPPPVANYGPAVAELKGLIGEQLRDKGIPALSIALVDDQTVVFAGGFGQMHPLLGRPATDRTTYRVGSVSKLYTDLAVMQLVEQGKLDLDAPIGKIIRRFTVEDPEDRPITLRHLMSHRAGLVREPPVGNYFDASQPTLEATVRSLNDTKLLYRPGEKLKYSNAGIATVGYAVAFTAREPFELYAERALLRPMGMTESAFSLTPELLPMHADALMWTHTGRTFPAPTWEMGLGPAGSMVSTVRDQARLLRLIHGGGTLDGAKIVKPETLAEMMTPQFAKPGDAVKVGLGFFVSDWEGTRRVGHGGAVYGFATEFACLPDEKLGVIVCASKDVANGVTARVADEALRLMRATKAGRVPTPTPVKTAPVGVELARRVAGRYRDGESYLDLLERDGRVWILAGSGGYRIELKRLVGDKDDTLITDDLHSFGRRVTVSGDKLTAGGTTYTRVDVAIPAPLPDAWKGLVGDYGPSHNVLTILEKDGRLHALIEWAFLYPLTRETDDVFRFPAYGLYQDEKLYFTRGEGGRATSVKAAEVTFARRRGPGDAGATFKIRPTRPVAQLRPLALAATPPKLAGEFREPELVDLMTLDPSIKFDIRYATANNFLGTPLYTSARAFLQKPAAEALLRAHKKLEGYGYGLLVYDAYRPWHVTKLFRDATPPAQWGYVADPAKGSRHNRGCAVDLTLYDRKTGEPVEMPSGFDEFTERAAPDYLGGTGRARWLRDLLRRAMQAEGFSVYDEEWWHFDHADWARYGIGNRTFEELGK